MGVNLGFDVGGLGGDQDPKLATILGQSMGQLNEGNSLCFCASVQPNKGADGAGVFRVNCLIRKTLPPGEGLI